MAPWIEAPMFEQRFAKRSGSGFADKYIADSPLLVAYPDTRDAPECAHQVGATV